MSKVRYVKPEHAAIIRDYLGDDPAVVLIMPEVHDLAKEQNIPDGGNIDFVLDEPDHWVECVSTIDDALFIEFGDDD